MGKYSAVWSDPSHQKVQGLQQYQWSARRYAPAGATFEIYDKAQNVVDTVVSNERGLAISKLLPLGRYTIKETKAPKYYGVSGETFEAEIEFASQIVRLEVLDESVYTNVVIGKSGPKQVTPGMQMKWTISRVANNSSIRLTSFYWRDNLPYQAVQLIRS